MRSKVTLMGIGLLGLFGLGFLVKKGAEVITQTDNIAQKFIFDFGSFRIHKVDFSGIVIAVDGIKIYNQSQFSATIQNLYVNVKYLSGTSQSPLLIQDNFLNPISINANSANVLPTILFKLSTTNLIVLYQMYKKTVSDNLFVNVRFQVLNGIEISLDQTMSIAPQLNMLKQLFENPIVKLLLGNGSSSASTQATKSANNGNSMADNNTNYQNAVAQIGSVSDSLFKN